MLEKELAQATRMAEDANKRVEKLRERLLAETEKAHNKVKRDLEAARKKHKAATERLEKARAQLRSNSTSANQKRVDALLKQVGELTDTIASMARAAYEYAEKLVPIRADLVLEARKAQAAERAAEMVEKAAARQARSGSGKKAPAKKKAAAKKSSAAGKKSPAKKSPGRKKAAAKKTTAKKKTAARKKSAAPKKRAPAKKAAAAS
jgi:hypothetical protein